MSKVWDKIYESDTTFFGKELSSFVFTLFNDIKANNVKRYWS